MCKFLGSGFDKILMAVHEPLHNGPRETFQLFATLIARGSVCGCVGARKLEMIGEVLETHVVIHGAIENVAPGKAPDLLSR